MKPILISGAFGFVGTNLAHYLHQRGYTLWGLDIQLAIDQAVTRELFQTCFTWEQLNNIPSAELQAVIHLAGKAHDTKNTSAADAYFAINTGLTEKLVTTLTTSPTPSPDTTPFILFSTVKAAADTVATELTEDITPTPQTPYGKSKLAAEQIVTKAPLKGYILRPAMIHGPGNKGNLNLLYKINSIGLPWPLGAFDNHRSFTSITNICAIVEQLLPGQIPVGIYNIADDQPLSTNQLITLIAASRGRTPHIWHLPPRFIRTIARIGDFIHLPLNSERLQKLTESYIVNNSKIKQALGWAKMPLTAEQGLNQTLSSF
ncbi:MAG: NAD-dependent epimerase/dehydratase family protein [Lentisphaerae bacterium]|nr:NAD-dependent epimerase/dehydratase family protein [Lentisphaerota bacterium]